MKPMELVNDKEANPFAGYFERLKQTQKKVNPVHEIVNLYYKLNNMDSKPKEFYKGRYGYGKLAKEAKQLLTACGGSLDDALWAVDQMLYRANKGGFDWSIITCLKHKLTW